MQRYCTLDGVLEAGLFKTQAELLRLYRLIATMDAKEPLPSLADQEPTWGSASTFARDRGLNQLADRFAEIGPLRSDGETLAEAMRAAGDQVEQKTFPGVTHDFFGLAECHLFVRKMGASTRESSRSS